MSAKVYTENERAAILGTILSNPKASLRDIEGLLEAQGCKVSRHILSDYKHRAKELVFGLAYNTEETDEVIRKPVVQSGLIDAATRINELNEIYYQLKAELKSGALWTERIHNDIKGDTTSEYVFNADLIKEMRGCLNDIAKEVGGRSTRAIIEHRNADTGSVDIHAMILNVQQAAEKRQGLSAPTGQVDYPEKKEENVIDLTAEGAFLDQYDAEGAENDGIA